MKFPQNYDTHNLALKINEEGYLVRTSGNGLPAVLDGCIRITVGTLIQMKTFVKDIISYL